MDKNGEKDKKAREAELKELYDNLKEEKAKKCKCGCCEHK